MTLETQPASTGARPATREGSWAAYDVVAERNVMVPLRTA